MGERGDLRRCADDFAAVFVYFVLFFSPFAICQSIVVCPLTVSFSPLFLARCPSDFNGDRCQHFAVTKFHRKERERDSISLSQ